MKTICICSQKGGTGKTSIGLGLAYGLRHRSKSVLLIDLDSQGNTTNALGYNPDDVDDTFYDVLCGSDTGLQGAVFSPEVGLSVLPLGYIISDDGITDLFTLRAALQSVASSYDYCVIDTSPSLGKLVMSALIASDYVLIPVTAESFSLQGVQQLRGFLDVADSVRADHGIQKITVLGMVFNLFDGRLNITKAILSLFPETGMDVLETKIRKCVSIPETQLIKTDIYRHAPRSSARAEFDALTTEILTKIGE